MRRTVFALDGHDAAGKTTLALLLADHLRAQHVRPFAGEHGVELIQAYKQGNQERVLQIGTTAISHAIAQVPPDQAVVLDRGWLTVSTLVPADFFLARWRLWMPTALLFCDISATIERLQSRRDEKMESIQWHEHFLAVYLDRWRLSNGCLIRTDLYSTTECLIQLVAAWHRSR